MSIAYHPFSLHNRHFVLDVEQSFLYAVSPTAFHEITKSLGQHTGQSRVPWIDRFRAKLEWWAVKRNIRPLSEQERQQEIQNLIDRTPNLVGIWLGVSHLCNLACDYCFVNESAYRAKKGLMSVETALRGVDYLVENSGNNEELSVIFFGGEPLLNMSVIDAVTAYCREKEEKTGKQFQYGLTTNGTLLTKDVLEKLNESRICPLISIDGTREAHDRYRRTKSGEPTWDKIMANLQAISNLGEYAAVRATVVEDDTDLVSCLNCLKEIGFSDILISGVCPNSGLNDNGVGEFDITVWKSRYLELVEYIVNTATTIDEIPEYRMREDVNRLLNSEKTYFCCGTGRYSFYLDPDGDFYPCFRLITPDSRERIGSLDSSIDMKRVTDFFQTNVLSTSCFSCWARYMCGGPCFGDSFYRSMNLSTPDPVVCEKRKFAVECAAYILEYFKTKEVQRHGQ